MRLSRAEKKNLLLFFGGGVALAVLLAWIRIFAEHQLFGIPESVFRLQYILGFIVLGSLMLLFWKANTASAKQTCAVMVVAAGGGLLFPPAFMTITDAVSYAPILFLVLGGGYYYYRFSQDSSNTLLVGILTILSHEFYLFGAAYLLFGFITVGDPLLLIMVLVITLMLYGVRSILSDELRRTQDDSLTANLLTMFLKQP